MPLDPQAQALLAQLAATGAPPLHQQSVADARAMMASFTPLLGDPEPVAAVDDRTVPGPAGPIPVRIYTPKGTAPFPLLVYFHGGGWVIGGLDTHDGVCRSLANEARCIVLSVDYRLAPEHKFPAAAEDCYAATCWAAANAGSFGADPARLAVGGDSAGGNLTAVVSLMARDRGTPRLRHQLLIYPATDAALDAASYRENATGYFLETDGMVWFWNHYLRNDADRANPLASPLRAADLRGLPPALVITAEFDPLRDEGEAYAARLRAADVPTTLTRYDGMIHGFFAMGVFMDQGKAAIREAGAALRAAFAR